MWIRERTHDLDRFTTHSFARITAVGALAIVAGYCLLRRRPDIVPGLSLAGLLSGCVLLAVSGVDLPTLWESPIPVGQPALDANVSGGREMSSDTGAANATGISLAKIGEFLRNLDEADSKVAFSTSFNVMTVLAALIALAFCRLLFGLVATFRFHKQSTVVSGVRLQKLRSKFDGMIENLDDLEFRESEQAHAPCVTAIKRRCIYLPADWRDYSDDELAASVMHELGHLSRGDARWRLLAQIATAFQVFHPLSHGLLRQLVIAQELSADRWAVNAVGRKKFVRGISQLALRLDNAALPRRAQGIGMSHSSSFLIRRIKMLRNGMPACQGKTHWLTRRFATLAVVAVAVVAASWSLSAEEPIRVASRITDAPTSKLTEDDAKLWSLLPGRAGYWSLNVKAALEHQVLGVLLTQADATFLTPGWMMIATDDARDRRAELGLSIQNISRLSGTVKMVTETLKTEESEPKYHMSGGADEFIITMRRDVDWSMVAASLADHRLYTHIRGLIGPDFPKEGAERLVQQYTFSDFFALQTDPRRFMLKQEAEEESPPTAQVIKSLWKDFGGEIATAVIKLPTMIGPTETRMQELMQTLHEAAEYEVVGVDPSIEPGKIRMRIGVTPRKGSTAEEVLKLMSAVIEATIEQSNKEHEENDEPLDASEELILNFLKTVKPEIRKSSNPSFPSTVMVEGDVMPSALWLAIGG